MRLSILFWVATAVLAVLASIPVNDPVVPHSLDPRSTDKATNKRPSNDLLTPTKKPKTSADDNCEGGTACLLPSSDVYDLLPDIKAYSVPRITAKNRDGATNVINRTAVEYIPDDVTFVRKNFDMLTIESRHYRVRDRGKYLKAVASLAGAPGDEDCLMLEGEISMSGWFMAAVVNPVRQISRAIFNVPSRWEMTDLGNGPKTDFLLKIDGYRDPVLVLEAKTQKALTSEIVTQILDNVENFNFAELPLVDPTSPKLLSPPKRYRSLVDPNDRNAKLCRGNRDKSVLMMEQVVAQMFKYKVRYGVLTNFHDWIGLERTGPQLSTIVVGHPTVIVDNRNAGLDLILDLTVKSMLAKLGGDLGSLFIN